MSPLKAEDRGDLVPRSGRISLLSLLRDFQLVVSFGGVIPKGEKVEEDQLRSVFGTISKSNTWEILQYLLKNGAITSIIARNRLLIPRRSAFRSLEELKKCGLVEFATRAKVPTMKGYPGNVYRLLGADAKSVRKAVTLHNLLFSSRKYRLANNLAQTIIEEFNEKGIREIAYPEAFNRVKELKTPLSTGDLTEMVCKILHEQGVRVRR